MQLVDELMNVVLNVVWFCSIFIPKVESMTYPSNLNSYYVGKTYPGHNEGLKLIRLYVKSTDMHKGNRFPSIWLDETMICYLLLHYRSLIWNLANPMVLGSVII